MNGIALDEVTLMYHLEFVREEIGRIRVLRVQLQVNPGVKSDDGNRLLVSYERILQELHYLLQYDFDTKIR